MDCHEDRPIGCDESRVFSIISNGSLAKIKISHLRKYTAYSLSVQVFNSKGRGNFSRSINITTDEDSKFIYVILCTIISSLLHEKAETFF